MSSNAISGSGDDAVEFAKALGIDPNGTFKIELDITADEIVTVTIHRHVTCTELQSLTTILKKYNLIREEK
jgi:hypothetical protein